jgi:hypothetical protein
VKNKNPLGSFKSRTRTVRERCWVRGCDGHITRKIQPMLLTPDDQLELYGGRFPIERVKGASAGSIECSTRGTADVTIQGACGEGVEIAGKLGRPVVFDFNGVLVVCQKDDDPEKLWRKWWKKRYGETYEQSVRRR